jgi:IPT/TIG domain
VRAWLPALAVVLLVPGVADAATTVGSPLTAAPQAASTCGAATFFNSALGVGTLQAPFDGVVVRWRVAIATGSGSLGYKLRVLRPAGGSTYTGAGTGPAQPATSAGTNLLTLPTPLPIRAGDVIGVDCPTGAPAPFAVSPPASSKFGFFSSPALADGSTRTPTNQIGGDEELINADIIGVPVITSVGPASGPAAGGTTVTISGSRLADVTGVTFGGTPAIGVTVISDSQVRATAPAHAPGPVDVQAIDVAGTSPVAAGDSFTYQAPPAPTVANLIQSHKSWRSGRALATLARHRAPLGTTFSFGLDQPSTVRLAFTQNASGRSVNGRCVAQTRKNRKRHACKRTVPRGTLSMTGHTGTNKLTFQGHLTRSKMLKTGRYSVTITATNAGALTSAPKSLSFKIVKQ